MATNTQANLSPEVLALLKTQLAQMQGGARDSNGTIQWGGANGTPLDDWVIQNYARGTQIGSGDQSDIRYDPNNTFTTFSRPVADSAGKLIDVFDQDGKWLSREAGTDSVREMNTAIAMMAAGYFGGGALGEAAGASGAAGAAGGADAATSAAWANGAGLGGDTLSAMGATGTTGAATGGMAGAAGTLTAESLGTIEGLGSLGTNIGNIGADSIISGTGTAGAGTLSATDVAKTVGGSATGTGTAGTGTAGNMTTQNWVDLAKTGTVLGTTLATSGGSNDAQAKANSISDAQLQGMQFALDQARELSDYNKATFRPIEQQLAKTAQEYDTEGRRESAAQSAAGEVATEFDRTRQQAAKEMTRYGVDPSTMQALGTASLLDEAKARAGAANKARSDVEAQGWSRMADVANLGRNIASSQATQQQIGVSAGNSASDSAYKSAKLQQDEDKMLIEGVGQIGNYVGNLFASSDKNKKAGTGKMSNAAKALKEVERTPVHEGWSYKDDPAKKKHTGPMAQDVKRVSGEKAAPGGKVIDMVSQQGRMMAAVQELSRRVKKLEAA
jgi:hypothetical protein